MYGKQEKIGVIWSSNKTHFLIRELTMDGSELTSDMYSIRKNCLPSKIKLQCEASKLVESLENDLSSDARRTDSFSNTNGRSLDERKKVCFNISNRQLPNSCHISIKNLMFLDSEKLEKLKQEFEVRRKQDENLAENLAAGDGKPIENVSDLGGNKTGFLSQITEDEDSLKFYLEKSLKLSQISSASKNVEVPVSKKLNIDFRREL